jgi:hypothetical protein
MNCVRNPIILFHALFEPWMFRNTTACALHRACISSWLSHPL